jgi:predicted O-methyltransferase YrrM
MGADEHRLGNAKIKGYLSEVESRFDKNLNIFKSRLVKKKQTSLSFFSEQTTKSHFDFIYIDGDHSAEGVYNDASLAFPLLKSGGILAFDDYLWEHPSQNVDLKPLSGIDKFLKNNELRIKILHKGYQVWIEKV